jgi:glyoxylase-like metal-dependent hydrolase (beta-lactamase superfamily II)
MLRLHVFNTGWAHMWDRALYWGGRRELRLLPILAFLIEHPGGLFVFDTGLDPSLAARTRGTGKRLGDRVVRFRSSPEMSLPRRMKEQGLPPEEVRYVALSHLHSDHVGGLHAFPQARVLLTRQEWQAAQSPFGRLRGYLRQQYAGLTPTLVDLPTNASLSPSGMPSDDCGLDCMSDGSLFLVPTFGHTAGHQALLAFLPLGVVLLAGDAVYVRDGYLKPAAQPHAQFPDLEWRSLIALRALVKADPSAIILPAHDSSALQGVARPDIVIEPTSLTPPSEGPGGRP